MKKFKKEPAPDKENLNEDITEAEEEIAAEEEEAKTAAADDEIEKLQAENRQLKEEFLRAYADAENTKNAALRKLKKQQICHFVFCQRSVDRCRQSAPRHRRHRQRQFRKLRSAA